MTDLNHGFKKRALRWKVVVLALFIMSLILIACELCFGSVYYPVKDIIRVLLGENIEDLVKEVIRKYAIFFIQKGLSVDLHDLDRRIVTDKKWLLVVIEQILSNSLKYTNEGGVEIYMEGSDLCIKDTGIGIKNSDRLRVFERGFSGYNGRMTQQSSGLGLYLTQKISQELGHQIQIESELGQGTTVRIKFSEVNLLIE